MRASIWSASARVPEFAATARARLERLEREPQSREALAQIVVQVARDPPPLFLLRGHEPAQQPDPRRLGLGPIGDFGGQECP